MNKYLCLYIQEEYGTPADKMEEQIPEDIKHERFNRLKQLVESQIEENNSKYINTKQKILVEGKSKTNENMLTGRTETNKVVVFEGNESLINQIIEVEIVKDRQWYLEGKLK